ncbi:MAG TPA: D-aminoacyl-tRNA deacylase [Acidimicrobiales bacterium]|nr:D-aminoacyl-tRNA deacylase [Acidimicrobiales bacterium]|tara:strand:- start:3300 stop:3737 length:438 start_codon:yes stop_codon:yes gene_type:complete
MRALIQRVEYAKVTVEDEIIGSIGPGLCVLVGVTHTDGAEESRKIAKKITKLRIFDDSEGVMNLSPLDTSSEILVISQFTLYGDTSRGNRPSWINAAKPEHAEPLIEEIVKTLREEGLNVATGRFRAYMKVELVNDGPSTVMIEI